MKLVEQQVALVESQILQCELTVGRGPQVEIFRQAQSSFNRYGPGPDPCLWLDLDLMDSSLSLSLYLSCPSLPAFLLLVQVSLSVIKTLGLKMKTCLHVRPRVLIFLLHR